MGDPVLFLHRVQGTLDVYDTGSVQSPASIRDQILRGSWIVDRAYKAGRIGPNKPLLVVGAGAAGVSAAIRAADMGVVTHLVEETAGAFSRQRQCSTRWIDPSIYEWPLAHHANNLWGNAPPMPLPYSPDRASTVVVRDWLPLLVGKPYLFTYWQHKLPELPQPYGGRLVAKVEDIRTSKSLSVDVSAVLWAGGAGEENTRCNDYRGYHFWEVDPYDHSPLLSAGVSPHVVISGGGDGALQDLLRITFDPTQVTTPRALLPLLSRLPTNALMRLQSAEDQSQRALIWNGGTSQREHDHPILERVHLEYLGLAQSFARDPVVQQELLALVREPLPKITFVHPCTHFSRCYPINRFVGLMLTDILTRLGLLQYLPGNGVVDVTAAKRGKSRAHVCARDPNSCHGVNHDVTIENRDCHNSHSKHSSRENFNIIILRHGLTTPTIQRATALRIRRHMLPYEFT